MPHYYFDLLHGSDLSPDEEGLDFPDLGTAKDEALRALGEMVAHLEVRPEAALQIRNEAGEVECTVRLAEDDC